MVGAHHDVVFEMCWVPLCLRAELFFGGGARQDQASFYVGRRPTHMFCMRSTPCARAESSAHPDYTKAACSSHVGVSELVSKCVLR